MSRINARLRGDDGMAMVMTIGLMMLTAIIATTLLATTVFTTSNTTATRASVEAVAAAEAGIEATMVSLSTGAITCDSSLGSVSSPDPDVLDYQVSISHKPSGSAVWTPGCAVDADAIRLVSVATAQSVGTSGNERGDEATAELLMERPNPQPRFTKAIFGDVRTTTNTSLTIDATDPADTADVYTNGDYTCASHSVIAGSVFAQGNGTFSSAPCTVQGDVYIGGNFTCGGGTTIDGDLYVQGNITLSSATCVIHGNVWSGGFTSIPNGGTPIGGNLFVRGNYSTSGLASVGGAIRIRGTFPTGHWRTQYETAYPTMVVGDAGLGMPPAIPTSPDHAFPRLSQTLPAVDHPFATFSAGNWVSAVTPLRPASWVNVCGSGGVSWTTPLVISTDTVMDTTVSGQCPGGLMIGGTGFKIVLNADLVIYANGFEKNGDLTVVSGDGEEHSLYIIQPWPTSQLACPASVTGSMKRIVSPSGKWMQPDNLTRIMLYSPTLVEFKGTNPHLRGQIYGCTVSLPVDNTSITYAPVGAEEADPGLAGLNLQYIRDVTN